MGWMASERYPRILITGLGILVGTVVVAIGIGFSVSGGGILLADIELSSRESSFSLFGITALSVHDGGGINSHRDHARLRVSASLATAARITDISEESDGRRIDAPWHRSSTTPWMPLSRSTPRGKSPYSNAQAEIVFGWHRSEVLGRGLEETIVPSRFVTNFRLGLTHFSENGDRADGQSPGRTAGQASGRSRVSGGTLDFRDPQGGGGYSTPSSMI
ncbi:MAG: hypothetical protein U1D30_17555 [Planctomycetota bacterium]